MKIDSPRIWEQVTREFQCGPRSIHGPSHWHRVERNGLLLAKQSGASEVVVRLFAVFHDSRREHDGYDTIHGARGADYAKRWRGKLFELSDKDFDLLHYACTWHTHSQTSKDPTIGTCWDADRLDLGRVAIIPDPEYMSTAFGREIATKGSIEPFLRKARRNG
jgi:uncharacterized protein